MKNFNKRMAAREGFTLVELIVVIAILAILAAVAYPAYTGYIDKANSSKDLTNLSGVLTAVQASCASEPALGSVTEIEVTFGAKPVINVKTDKVKDGFVFVIFGESTPAEGSDGHTAAETFKTLMPSMDLNSKTNKSATWSAGEWKLEAKSGGEEAKSGGEEAKSGGE